MNSASSSPARHAELRELRALLKQKFPEAHRSAIPVAEPKKEEAEPKKEEANVLVRGIPALEAAGMPAKGLMELVSEESAGMGLILWGLIRNLLASSQAVALVDGADGWDMAHAWPEDLMGRLLWIRCHEVNEALRAMDLLVRDGNVHHLILDLQNARKQSCRIPSPVWYRLRNVAEETGLWVLVASREPIVPCAVMRGRLTTRFGLRDLHTPRETLLTRLTLNVEHRRSGQPASPPLRQVS